MCGIAGIFDVSAKRDISRSLLEKMTRLQAHRGPDGEGYHLEPGVGLGHRRLSIIDIGGGHQPLYNEDGSVAVTYNGEIYNFKEVRQELLHKGHVFKTNCDTEIIVHAWEEWGRNCVDRFNGMFAFGVWDRNQDCLFLARDRLGIKPLYYALTDDGFLIFSSELKALMPHQGLAKEIDIESVEDYFAFGYVPDPKTIYSAVRKLPPGFTLSVTRGRKVPEPSQYWDISFNRPYTGDNSELDDELIDRFRESVQRRLIAEVPLGAFLSGGVDSSAVVAMMSQLNDDAVNTCSISFGDPQYNESRYADQVAQRYATNHRTKNVDHGDFSLLEKLPGIYDEPYADSSAIPTYRVCELARESVTVALSGDGGDENFIGYRRYRWHQYEERVRRLLPQALRGPVFGALGAIYPKLDWAPKPLRAKSTFQALARDSLEAYFRSVSFFPTELRRKLYSPDFTSSLAGYEALEVFREHAAKAEVNDGLQLAQYLDFKTYLPGDILTKVDRASMAHSLEVRVPMLDYQFVEWVATIPSREKLSKREGKACLKHALRPYLSDEILYRDKMGFAVPISQWFRRELADEIREVISGNRLRDCGFFDNAYLDRLLKEHQSGAGEHSPVLWSLLMFDGFLGGQEA